MRVLFSSVFIAAATICLFAGCKKKEELPIYMQNMAGERQWRATERDIFASGSLVDTTYYNTYPISITVNNSTTITTSVDDTSGHPYYLTGILHFIDVDQNNSTITFANTVTDIEHGLLDTVVYYYNDNYYTEHQMSIGSQRKVEIWLHSQ